MSTKKSGMMAVRSGLAITLMLIASLVFMASADIVLAEDVGDGEDIPATQTVDGTWGPGVISATNSVAINAGVVITVAPNTTVLVADGEGITVTGDLHTEGPVVFTGISETPGAWQGVTYAPDSTGSLDGATIEYAQHALTLNTTNPVTVANSTLRYNQHAPASNQLAFGAGLTIQQGNHLIENTQVYSNAITATGSGQVRGAGIYIIAGSPRIVNSQIYENTATGANAGTGGGIAILAGAPVIEASSITTNTLTGSGNNQLKSGAGIGFAGATTAEIRECWIAGNRNDLSDGYAGGGGVGFASNGTAALIEQSVIYDNYVQGPDWCEGSGIDTWDETNAVVIRNNLIISNTSGTCLSGYGAYGGGANLNGSATGVYVINNTIVGNVAGRGGGLYLQAGTVYVLNNVIAYNTATIASQGGGIQRDAGTVDYNDLYGNATVQTVGTMGAQNAYIDPVFLGTGDLVEQYHLSQASPVIDAGTDSGTGLPTTDYDGDSRPAIDGWDMGFDEIAEIVPLLALSKSADHEPVAPGDVLTYTILVSNVGPVKASDVTLSDPLPLHTAYVPGSSLVSLSGATKTYSDTLAVVAYNGSDGTLNWILKPWTEIGETDGATTGNVLVTSDGGDYSIRIAGSDQGVSRRADLSNYDAATLTFDYRRAGFDDAADYVMLEASDDGGTSWTELDRYNGPATDSSYVMTASYPLDASYLVTNTMIRFYSSGLAADDYFYVDNVQIEASLGPSMTAGGTPPDLASAAMLLDGQQMTITYAVEVDSPVVGGTLLTNTASVTATGMPALESSVASTVIEVPPSAVDDSGATDEDTVLDVAASGVLGNDVDLNGDSLTVTTYDAASVAGAVVTVAVDGGYTYDPTGVAAFQALVVGESVTDTFTYTISDGNGGSDTATVTVEVTGLDDVPVVADQAFNVAENRPDDTVVGTVAATDADSGAVLTYTIVAGNPAALFMLDPATGVLTVTDGSQLDFETTPTYVLTVMVTDQSLLTDTASITIDVDDVVYAPVLEMVKDGPAMADVGEVVTYTFTISHAVSSDGTPVEAVEVTDSVAGTASYVSGDVGSDGILAAGEIWTYRVTYTIQMGDPSPLVNEGTVTAEDLDGEAISATADHSTMITGYTLDVIMVGNGTVEKDPDWATYRYGNVVTLTATAAPGWRFEGWSGDAVATTEEVSVLIDGNKVVTATFTDVPAGIAVNVSADPTAVHDPGEMVTFTVRVDNTSTADGFTLNSLTDDVHGDLNGQGSCAVPQSIAAGSFYECSFTALVSGVEGETKTVNVTASGVDEDDNPLSHSDEVSVGVVPKIPAIGDYVLFLPLVMR